MGSMRNWMLGAALAVVGLGLGMGATPAHAAELGVYIGGRSAYMPPSPGPGYFWVAGYMNNGFWIAGHWQMGGYGYRDRDDRYRGSYGSYGGYGYYGYGNRDRDHDRRWDRDRKRDRYRGWDRDRRWDRDRKRDRRWDRDRRRHDDD